MAEFSRREMVAGMASMALVRPGKWDETAAFIEARVQPGIVPGAAVIASINGKRHVSRCWGTYYGLANPTAPLAAEVIHPLYSFSKLVTSTVVAMAQQEGLLDYDAPVSRYVPEYRGGGKDATIVRHLLTHAAGIPSVPIGSVRSEEEWKAAIAALCAAKAEWEPGSRTAYHGLTGHLMAAEVVRRVSNNSPWNTICRKRLFGPLAARSLTFNTPPDTAPVAITPQPANHPAHLVDQLTFADHPAGGCFGTIADALKVVELHAARGVWKGRQLLTPAAWAEMHRVQYADQMAAAIASGKPVTHEPWGLGMLIRGSGPRQGGHDWFGLGELTSPTAFSHAGIDTVIGVGDPATGAALVFVTTNSPKPNEETSPLRCGVAKRVMAALG